MSEYRSGTEERSLNYFFVIHTLILYYKILLYNAKKRSINAVDGNVFESTTKKYICNRV